ncbi:MAG: disulfide bond formation protein DsbA [Acidobacteria bacterium]|nr:MAG: disulfide bond formation protein DsbA [Acidobacteriota bacterium]
MSKKRETRQAPPPQTKHYLPFIIIAVVLVAAVAVGAWLWRSARKSSGTGAVAVGAPGAQPPHASGRENAPLTLEEFGDYQCPPCGNAYPEVEKIRTDYGDKLRFIFRQYPLTQAHQSALVAAHAAEAAGVQGKFWEMHDRLFRTQRDWSKDANPRAIFETYASAIGLDLERFKRDMDSAEVDARIVADHERGNSLGVKSTPTFFLNGRELPADKLQTPTDLRSFLDAALAGKSF